MLASPVVRFAADVSQTLDGLNTIQLMLALSTVVILAPTWMSWWNSRIMRKQVTPNGGSSLTDKVDKIAENVNAISAKVDVIDARQQRIRSRLERSEAQSDVLFDHLGLSELNEDIKSQHPLKVWHDPADTP